MKTLQNRSRSWNKAQSLVLFLHIHENRYVEIHQCLVVVNLWSQKDGRVTLYPDVVTVVTTILDVRLYIQFLTYAKKHAT